MTINQKNKDIFSEQYLRAKTSRIFAYLYFGYEPDQTEPEYLAFVKQREDIWRQARLERKNLPLEFFIEA